MANINFNEQQYFERLFNMSSGYVLDFTNASFQMMYLRNRHFNLVSNFTDFTQVCPQPSKVRPSFEQYIFLR
jgi:hypothetical protein